MEFEKKKLINEYINLVPRDLFIDNILSTLKIRDRLNKLSIDDIKKEIQAAIDLLNSTKY